MQVERTIYVHDRHRIPLALKARFEWTFFGVGLFAAINLFLLGCFLLQEAIRNPLLASETRIVGAAFMLAFAVFVFGYLVRPRCKAVFRLQARAERRQTLRSAPHTGDRVEDRLQRPIEDEQSQRFNIGFAAPIEERTLTRAPEPTGSAPAATCDDVAHVRQ